MDHTPRRVAVIGAGASGTLTAIQLLRAAREAGRELHVQLIDRRGQHGLGRGVAYNTQDSRHRLNVPASGMTALPHDPDHFMSWSAAQGRPLGEYDFAERSWFGRYLRELLLAERDQAAAVAQLTIFHGQAVDIPPGDALTVRLADGTRVETDAVVLALGNAAPTNMTGLEGEPRVVDDPWSRGALGPVAKCSKRLLLVGTGLTMVDMALTLAGRCPDAELVAISRHGMLPRAHSAEPAPRREPVVEPRPGLRLVEVAAAVTRAVQREPREWRSVLDSLRPVTQAIWTELPLDDKRRFLAQYGRLWEVHRHRTAPAVTAELRGLIDSGRLTIKRGELATTSPRTAGRVAARLRSGDADATFEVDWIVNCTGPDADVRRLHHPLIRGLLDSGRARAHPLCLGFDVDARGRLIDVRGEADDRVLAVGPLRRGALLETTAVPEIREQAREVAELLVASDSAARSPAAGRAA